MGVTDSPDSAANHYKTLWWLITGTKREFFSVSFWFVLSNYKVYLRLFSGRVISLRPGPAACLDHSWQLKFPLLGWDIIEPSTSHFSYLPCICPKNTAAPLVRLSFKKLVKCRKEKRKWVYLESLGFHWHNLNIFPTKLCCVVVLLVWICFDFLSMGVGEAVITVLCFSNKG